jgi:hypothetical protein
MTSIKSLLTKDTFVSAEFNIVKSESNIAGRTNYIFTKTLGESVRKCKLFICEDIDLDLCMTTVSFSMHYNRKGITDHVVGRLFKGLWTVHYSDPDVLLNVKMERGTEAIKIDKVEFAEFIENFTKNPIYKSEILFMV